MKKRKFLITGATGFVGSCLVRKLVESGEEVHLLLRQQAKTWRIKDLISKVVIHESDLSNIEELKKIIKKINPTVIYHLAANGAYSSQNDPDLIIQTNFLGTWNLLKALMDIDYELFVNTGSSSEYGFKQAPMRETDMLEPASYYAVTKAAQTMLCSYIAKSMKKPIITFRLFSVYGPYEEGTRLVPTLMKALLFHSEMNLVNPTIARDMIYVDDVVEAYLLIDQLQKFAGESFNICTGQQSSIKQLVETAVAVTGQQTTFNWGGMENRSWDTSIWVGDSSKTKKMLNWQPKTTLDKGLLKMWNWYQENYKLYE